MKAWRDEYQSVLGFLLFLERHGGIIDFEKSRGCSDDWKEHGEIQLRAQLRRNPS